MISQLHAAAKAVVDSWENALKPLSHPEQDFHGERVRALAAVLRSRATPDQVQTLDEAWAEANAALPVGWWLTRIELTGLTVETIGGPLHRLRWWEALAKGPMDDEEKGSGADPAAALSDLSSRLRMEPR